MAFGIYVHIPYCLQRCVYCDFATYESQQILPPQEYVAKLKQEITAKAPAIVTKELDTLYFGGGTPSLLEPHLLLEIMGALREAGFRFKSDTEITLEINPATLSESKLDQLILGGFNRFSVGVQTFHDRLLKIAKRKHSAQDTRDTLSLLATRKVNFSADILFALPTQTLEDLKVDIEGVLDYGPKHISPYCLTVPESNPMAQNRPTEDDQVEMFSVIEECLSKAGFQKYEISNFALPGNESRHNLLYWDDAPYWGIGLSSHSYLKVGPWGTRFWNPRGIQDYLSEVEKLEGKSDWNPTQLDPHFSEKLQLNQALTDFFHTSLRKRTGVSFETFENKFQTTIWKVAGLSIEKLMKRGLLEKTSDSICLTKQGVLLSNVVFQEFTFLETPKLGAALHSSH